MLCALRRQVRPAHLSTPLLDVCLQREISSASYIQKNAMRLLRCIYLMNQGAIRIKNAKRSVKNLGKHTDAFVEYNE